MHDIYHPRLRETASVHGLRDLLVILNDGTVVYSTAKASEFGTDLLEGHWRDSKLADVVRAVTDAGESGFVAFSDFVRHAPSGGSPAAFMATDVSNAPGERAGTLVFRFDSTNIDAILAMDVGMGETGETYVFGQDLLMRGVPRPITTPPTLPQPQGTAGARRSAKT